MIAPGPETDALVAKARKTFFGKAGNSTFSMAKRDIDLVVSKEPNTGCWIWMGGTSTIDGYGRVNITKHKQTAAHRMVYELLRGPIAPGLHIDHLCRSPWCVNPDHLEPVTPRENVLRGIGPAARSARRTHCSKGHELADRNVYWCAKGVRANGIRLCRTCGLERGRRGYARRKLATVQVRAIFCALVLKVAEA